MRNTNKKGFTIVELVIVVAVIAILAAVLIPTFSGIINKAKLTSDQKAVREMNNAIAMESATTLDAAIAALEKHGINAKNLIPVSAGWSFVWDEDAKQIKLVEGTQENITESYKEIAVVVNTTEAFLDAIDEDMKYIKLEADVTLDSVIYPSGNVTIDLNGHNVDSSSVAGRPFELTSNSSLTINAEGSEFDCGLYGLVNVVAGAKNVNVEINGGTFKSDTNYGAVIKIRGGAVANVTLNNVTMIDAHQKYASKENYLINNEKGTLTLNVNGGTFTGNIGFCGVNTANIKGATFKTSGVSIYAANGTVTNCKFEIGNFEIGTTPTAAVAMSGDGVVEVNNCTITSSGMPAYRIYSGNGTIKATDCTVTGASDPVRHTNTGTIEIK